jgi:ABC-type Zn uptake system ZnuABC Zn-binding protein ZnuA
MDRSAGDVHVSGNPHYLVDPVSGALVADQLAARLGDLRPASRAAFEGRAAALRIRLGTLLFGAELAEAYDFTKLARLQQAGRLQEFLDSQGQRDRLGGVLRDFTAFRDAPVIADHDAWRYLTTQLGLRTIGFLEPRPGIPPSTSHLRELCDRAQVERPRALLHVAYFEPRAIDFVVEATGVRAVTLAHQVGALEGTGDYVAMVRENIARLAAALSAGTDSSGG